MTQDVKTVQLATNVDSTDGKIIHTESNGEWYIDEFRIRFNGDGDGSTPNTFFGVRPIGATVDGTVGTNILNVKNTNIPTAAEQTYESFSVDEYVDFDVEDVFFEFTDDQNGTYDVYLHLRRVL